MAGGGSPSLAGSEGIDGLARKSETAKLNEQSQFRLFMSETRKRLPHVKFRRVSKARTGLDNVARNAKRRPGRWSRLYEPRHRSDLAKTYFRGAKGDTDRTRGCTDYWSSVARMAGGWQTAACREPVFEAAIPRKSWSAALGVVSDREK